MYNTEKEELDFYRGFFKSVNGFGYVLQMNPHSVIWVSDNNKINELTGDSTEEIIRKGAFMTEKMVAEPDFRESVVEAIEAFTEDVDNQWGGVFRFVNEEDKQHWIAYTSATLSKDATGKAKTIACLGIPLDSFFNTPDTLRVFHNYCSVRLNEKLSKSLTKRQKEVLRLIGRGKIRKEIADELNLSIGTIDDHKKALFRKFGCKSMGQLAVKSHELGLLPTTNRG